jgi:uncharacterized membrane protein affecting hemolysin expression
MDFQLLIVIFIVVLVVIIVSNYQVNRGRQTQRVNQLGMPTIAFISILTISAIVG